MRARRWRDGAVFLAAALTGWAAVTQGTARATNCVYEPTWLILEPGQLELLEEVAMPFAEQGTLSAGGGREVSLSLDFPGDYPEGLWLTTLPAPR